jgi:hypothetical protein
MVPIARGNLMVPIFRKSTNHPKFLSKLFPAIFRKDSRQFIGSSFSEKIQQGATTRVSGLTRSEYLLTQMRASLLTEGDVGSSPNCGVSVALMQGLTAALVEKNSTRFSEYRIFTNKTLERLM